MLDPDTFRNLAQTKLRASPLLHQLRRRIQHGFVQVPVPIVPDSLLKGLGKIAFFLLVAIGNIRYNRVVSTGNIIERSITMVKNVLVFLGIQIAQVFCGGLADAYADACRATAPKCAWCVWLI